METVEEPSVNVLPDNTFDRYAEEAHSGRPARKRLAFDVLSVATAALVGKEGQHMLQRAHRGRAATARAALGPRAGALRLHNAIGYLNLLLGACRGRRTDTPVGIPRRLANLQATIQTVTSIGGPVPT